MIFVPRGHGHIPLALYKEDKHRLFGAETLKRKVGQLLFPSLSDLTSKNCRQLSVGTMAEIPTGISLSGPAGVALHGTKNSPRGREPHSHSVLRSLYRSA